MPGRGWLLAGVVAAAAVVAVLVPAAVVVPRAGAASSGSEREAWCWVYCTELMADFAIEGPYNLYKRKPGPYRFHINMFYWGGLDAQYRVLKHDTIPAFRVQLLLPHEVELIRAGRCKSHFRIAGYRATFHKKPPKSELRWTTKFGRPTWTLLNVVKQLRESVNFCIRGQPGQIVAARGQAFYFKKVRRGHRRVTVMTPVPHAPVQRSGVVLPPPPPPPTTTTP